MRIFLITLALSIGGTILFWNFGLAHRIWPAHPMLATSVIIGMMAMAVHILLTEKSRRSQPKSLPSDRHA